MTKLYEVELNSKGAPNFSTAKEVPQRIKGKWIPKEDRAKQEVFICSECGGWAYSPWIGSRKNPKPNWCKYSFCPNCGADMRGDDDAECADA